jgi:leucyl-tRNA synthetase
MLHGEDGEKMSKSRGNVVLPESVSEKYGMDTARLFVVSVASPDKDIDWSEKGVQGSLRFITRVFDYFDKLKFGNSSKKFESKLNKAIKMISQNIEEMKYNLAIIKLRELFDSFEGEVSKKDAESFLKLLHPFCPHISEELWEKLGNKNFLCLEKWPIADEKKINEKLEQAEKNQEKLILDIVNVLGIIRDKNNKEAEKVYVYVMPFEKEIFDESFISVKVGKDVKIFAVNDKNKYDPEEKAKKAKPGKPGVYVE